jgi:hypothetical protein
MYFITIWIAHKFHVISVNLWDMGLMIYVLFIFMLLLCTNIYQIIYTPSQRMDTYLVLRNKTSFARYRFQFLLYSIVEHVSPLKKRYKTISVVEPGLIKCGQGRMGRGSMLTYEGYLRQHMHRTMSRIDQTYTYQQEVYSHARHEHVHHFTLGKYHGSSSSPPPPKPQARAGAVGPGLSKRMAGRRSAALASLALQVANLLLGISYPVCLPACLVALPSCTGFSCGKLIATYIKSWRRCVATDGIIFAPLYASCMGWPAGLGERGRMGHRTYRALHASRHWEIIKCRRPFATVEHKLFPTAASEITLFSTRYDRVTGIVGHKPLVITNKLFSMV